MKKFHTFFRKDKNPPLMIDTQVQWFEKMLSFLVIIHYYMELNEKNESGRLLNEGTQVRNTFRSYSC
jgi:hypothetical protein